MPIPAYVAITDAQLAPEKPFTSSLAKQFRDNMLSVIQGGAGAPRMGPGLLSIGGGEADGSLTDAWAPTEPGYYDFTSDAPSIISTPASWQWFTYVRLLGDLEIGTTITIDGIPLNTGLHQFFRGIQGTNGSTVAEAAGKGSSGGASLGNAGDGYNAIAAGPNGFGTTALNRRWALPVPLFGGQGAEPTSSTAAKGGGCLVMMVDGDADLTGATLDCSGKAGSNSGAGAGGGGGGGSLFFFCSGTVTGGTFWAKGGAGGSEVSGANTGGGGGGGGFVALCAKAYAGIQTVSVAGGAGGAGGGNSGTSGSTGVSETITIDDAFLNALIRR